MATAEEVEPSGAEGTDHEYNCISCSLYNSPIQTNAKEKVGFYIVLVVQATVYIMAIYLWCRPLFTSWLYTCGAGHCLHHGYISIHYVNHDIH